MTNSHQWDQMMAAFRDIAIVLAKYREDLLAQGFTREEALHLVVAYQTHLLGFGNDLSK